MRSEAPKKPKVTRIGDLKFEPIGDLSSRTGKPYVWVGIGHEDERMLITLEPHEARRLGIWLLSFDSWSSWKNRYRAKS